VHKQLERAIKEVTNKKATGDDNGPGHVIKLGRRRSQANDTTARMKLESSPKISLKSQ